MNFRQVSNQSIKVFEAAKFVFANKTKYFVTSQKLGTRDFGQVTNSVCNKGKSAISPVFNGSEVLHIPVTPRLVKKVLTSLDSAKASGPDCIPVLILKNCEAEFSLILTELFSMCLARSCFSDFWKVSSVVTVLKNVGERSTTRNYHPDSLLSVATNIFEKLVNTVVGPQGAGLYETGYTGQKN